MKNLNSLKLNEVYKLHTIFKKQDFIMLTVGACMGLSGYVDPKGFWEIYNFITELEIKLRNKVIIGKVTDPTYCIIYNGYVKCNIYTNEHELNIRLVSETIIKLVLTVFKHKG